MEVSPLGALTLSSNNVAEYSTNGTDTMIRIRQIADSILNLLALIAAILICTVAIRYYKPGIRRSTRTSGNNESALKSGDRLRLPSITVSDNRVTLILALSTKCHWCLESADFYRDLVGANSDGAFHVVAVFPEPPSTSRAYLRSLNIEIPDVRQAQLAAIGVTATPTLVIVDHSANIEATWIGKLSAEKEGDVFRTLRVARTTTRVVQEDHVVVSGMDDLTLISTTQLKALQLLNKRAIPIVDTRPRAEYRWNHLSNSLNIPLDELEVRAVHEVPLQSTLAVWCDYCPPCQLKEREKGVKTFCSLSVSLLKRYGARDVRVISDSFPGS